MKWWNWIPWSLFSECWALSQLFHSPLSLSSRGSLVILLNLSISKFHWSNVDCFLNQYHLANTILSKGLHFLFFKRIESESVILSVMSESLQPHVPLSMEFPRQEYWSGLPLLSLGDLPDPGIKPGSPALPADSLPAEPPGKSFLRELHELIHRKYLDKHLEYKCLPIWAMIISYSQVQILSYIDSSF